LASSMQTQRRSKRSQTSPVTQEPAKGSTTRSPGSVRIRTKYSRQPRWIAGRIDREPAFAAITQVGAVRLGVGEGDQVGGIAAPLSV